MKGETTCRASVWVLIGICTETSESGDGDYTWDVVDSSNYYKISYDKGDLKGDERNLYRTHASDPQTGEWTGFPSSNRSIYVKVSNAAESTIALGGADLTGEDSYGDDEVWIDVRSSDASLVDGTDTVIQFSDGTHTATESIDITGEEDDTWVTVKLPKDGFTEATADFDWSAIESISIILNITGDDSSSTDIYLYVDKIRWVSTRVDSEEDYGSDTRPPKALFCETSPSGDRLLLANTEEGIDNSGSNFVWYSNAYDIDEFEATQFISFSSAITGIKTFGKLVHIFSKKQRWIMAPNYSQAGWTEVIDWEIALAHGPGTVSHRSIAEGQLGGEMGIFFLAHDGVYFTAGMDARKVSDSIDVLWAEKYSSSGEFHIDSFKKSKWGESCGFWHNNNYYLFYEPELQQDGTASADNEECLVLNTKTGAWSKDIPSASVWLRGMAVWEDASGIFQLLGYADNGEMYELIPSRATSADDGSAYQAEFQIPYLGIELMRQLSWETLNIWVKSDVTSASSIKVAVYILEDYDDTASYDEWEEDASTAILTVTKAWTPNHAFKWHKLRIQLDDNTNAVYPTARAISLKIYDDNDRPIDYMLESIIAEPLDDEVR